LSVTVNNPDRFQERPAAVLFDLDNTLYPYGPANEAGMNSVAAKASAKIGTDAHDFKGAFTRARDDVKRRLGTAASSHSRLLYFQRTLEYLGLRSQVTLSLEFEQTYWRNFLSAIELRPGVVSFLDQLSRASIPKVVVTDLTAQIQFRKLLYLDLDRRFEHVVTSEESGADKPDSAGFKLAMQKLSLTAGSVWMIGDNFAADIDGAKSAIGAATVGLKSEMGEYLSHPSLDMAFESFGDLKQFVTDSGWDNQTLV
jgi:putative hydrolase of the HAD superfamily